MRYEAIIFDKDGVLVDTEPFYDRRRREFFAEVGIDDSAFPSFYGSNNGVIWKTAVPADSLKREALYQRFRSRFANDPVPYAQLCVPRMREVLQMCRALGRPRWLPGGGRCPRSEPLWRVFTGRGPGQDRRPAAFSPGRPA